jgi:hypothetical protein
VGNTGVFRKNLLAGCDKQLKEVRSAFNAARVQHYTLTLPWQSAPTAYARGPRLLPNMLFDRYVSTMGALRRTAVGELDKFVDAYPELVIQAQANLAGMADVTDYPTAEEVKASFKLSFDFEPIPAHTDFGNLPGSFAMKLGERLKRRQEAAAHSAAADMWERVRSRIAHMTNKLADPEANFHASTLDHVRDLIVLLPGFNLTGDTRVDTIVEDIKEMLSGITAADVRNDAKMRMDVVQRARAIESKLAQWQL